MSDDKARQIIERAMTDRGVYDAMAARENEIWGRILPALEVSDARTEDNQAGAALRAGRHQSSLRAVAKEKGLKFKKGLTLGCGSGRLERLLLKAQVCESFHGVDISENAIADAREWASRESLPLTYEVADLNRVELPQKTFDLVVAQTCLHHVLFLEHVAEQVYHSLDANGYLWIHDFVGETQGQYQPKRLDLINKLLAALPEKFRTNKINNRVMREVVRPEPGHLGSPFEKIRSEEIIPVFEQWFTIEWKQEFTSVLDFVAPPGTRAAYAENEDTRALYEVLLLVDKLCIDERIVRPVAGQYLMRPKPQLLLRRKSDRIRVVE